jgi:choloylglycine hydrolase
MSSSSARRCRSLGLPRDMTPPSPFVRVVATSQTLVPVASAQEGVALMFHAMNQFDIPPSFVQGGGKENQVETTEWRAVANLDDVTYSF